MKKTLCLAHRGFSGRYPENTRAAFAAALAIDGCDGLESDVHLSKDGVPVIIHDDKLDRTTTGHGYVGAHTAKELQMYDAGTWFDPAFKDERIMLLSELLELVKSKNSLLNLEIKNNEVFYDGIERAVIREIEAAGMTGSVFLSSFNHGSMAKCKEINAGIRTGLLYSYPLFNASAYAKHMGADALHPRVTCLRYESGLVAAAHAAGLKLHTWTANTPEDMSYAYGLGVDGIISNYPDLLKEIIK